MAFLPMVLTCVGASWRGGDGGWPPGDLGAWGGTSRAMGLPRSAHTWPAELLALRVLVSCCPPGGFPGGLGLCRVRIGVGPGCLPQGACHPPYQASCLPETAPAAQPPVSPHRQHRTGCPELSPVSSRAGRKGVWVWPGGAAAPGARAPEEGKTGGGQIPVATSSRPHLLRVPLPWCQHADSGPWGSGARAPGSPPLMTGAPVMTSPALSLTPW